MLEWIRTRSKRDLVLAVAAGFGFLFLVGSFLSNRASHHAEWTHEVAEVASGGGVAFDQSFDVRAGGRLEVRLGDADVAVSVSEESEARVILHVDGTEMSAPDVLAEMGFEVRAADDGLTIRSESDGRDWGWGGHEGADLSLEVSVPSAFDIAVWTGDGDVAVGAFEGEIGIHTGDGDVAVAAASGPEFRIQTGDGDVSVAGVTSSRITISTGDGDVVAARLDGEDVHVRTGDGDILLQDIGGRFRASTGDGDVQVHLMRFEGLEIRTGDGDVTIHAPAGLRADVDFTGPELVIGDAFALPAVFDDRRLEGRLNGGGQTLRVRVGDGTIRLIER